MAGRRRKTKEDAEDAGASKTSPLKTRLVRSVGDGGVKKTVKKSDCLANGRDAAELDYSETDSSSSSESKGGRNSTQLWKEAGKKVKAPER